MKKLISFILLGLMSLGVSAKTDFGKNAMKLVPGGSVEQTERDEVTVKTAAGTLIEIEFNRDGSLDEVSGDMATKDNFVPGNGLLSLKDAVAALEKNGKKAEGEWSLDKDFMREWEYEFEGFENNQKFEYVINAKTGELLKSKKD